jgi:thiamine pyrophosphokinase
VKIIEISDQNSTDFTKSLKYTLDVLHSSQSGVNQIYCLGTFSGRFDHALANLHTLSSIANDTSKSIYIVSEESITFLLSEGKNVIDLNDAPQVLGKYCGFFPLLGPTIVRTSGFKWNLDKTVCAFDGQTSSSNEFSKENDSVVIETDKPLLFTMTIKPAQCVDYF